MAYKVINGKVINAKFKPNNVEGFRPDAGLNSAPGKNYYWFQVAEWCQTLKVQPKLRGYNINGKNYIEFNTFVDIMDEEGRNHLAPAKQGGYFATFRLNADQLNNLATQIDKGAMSVRITGTPAEIETAPSGEKFCVIDVEDSFSKGNNTGIFQYYFMVNGNMINSSSKDVATNIRNIVEQMRQAA